MRGVLTGSTGLPRHGIFGPRLLMIVAMLSVVVPASAVEIQFAPPPADAPPQRRLAPDPARPADSPSSLEIEYAAIKDDAQSSLLLASRALEASQHAHGQNDARTIIPLTNLGVARQRAGQARSAVADFRRAIELSEGLSSPRDLRLAEAHYGLGVALFEQGALQSAITAFENGLQQHRIGRGLYSSDQIDFLRALAVTNRALGRIDDAVDWQLKRVRVAEQAHAANLDTLAWNYISAGRWFRDVRAVNQAVVLHGQAVDLVQRAQGPESSQLIGPLLDLASSGAVWVPTENATRFPHRLGPGAALRRAYRLAMAREDGTPLERARQIERVGDFHWLFGLRREALRAWSRATELAQLHDERAMPFALPAFIIFRPPGIPAGYAAQPGHVLAEFTVDTRGRARDVVIVEGQPPEFEAALEQSLRKSIKGALLRPQLDGGRPTRTQEVRYRMVVSTSQG